MRPLSYWTARCGNALRAAAVAVDPGEDGESLDEPLDGLPTAQRDAAAAYHDGRQSHR